MDAIMISMDAILFDTTHNLMNDEHVQYKSSNCTVQHLLHLEIKFPRKFNDIFLH